MVLPGELWAVAPPAHRCENLLRAGPQERAPEPATSVARSPGDAPVDETDLPEKGKDDKEEVVVEEEDCKGE